jgi:hypothetical protein
MTKETQTTEWADHDGSKLSIKAEGLATRDLLDKLSDGALPDETVVAEFTPTYDSISWALTFPEGAIPTIDFKAGKTYRITEAAV